LSRRWRHTLWSPASVLVLTSLPQAVKVTTNKHARVVAQGVRPLTATVSVASPRSKIKELNIIKSVKQGDETKMEEMDSLLNLVSDM